MSTDANETSGLETEPALRGILALLVADRQERGDGGVDRAERILARAGLGADQIASITGHDANHVHAIIENDTVANRGRPHSVIDRAREVLTRRQADAAPSTTRARPVAAAATAAPSRSATARPG